ncbi:MAG: 4Fe-4S binding protein [Fermentimonas sp.]|jgi:NADH-quinone oxidoreductase subunit I
MKALIQYITDIFVAIKNLLKGMGVTWRQFWAKKVTMEYPENRDTLVISDRWRSELTMPHDENNEHGCTACGICMMNCPNGTITVTSSTVETEDGKKKRVLDAYTWNQGSCTFCNLCVLTCPSKAIAFTNDFEGAVFNKEKLIYRLNQPGSKLREKKKTQ